MRAKVSASHLERRACVYVRQSTMAQVFQNGESQHRQYALADRAVALGWPRESVDIIDEDQGRSGATSDGRTGFARLVEGVAHGKVGAVLALEASRLARSSEDWQRLLSLCAVAETVVIDEQGIYDLQDKDDKLLLDIKGTMSEAELHWLGLRLNGARRSKARRGQLRIRPPTGYVWTEQGLRLDPDEGVQRAVRMVFERYTVESSVFALARWANEAGLSFPTRRWYGDGTTEVEWKRLSSSRLYEMLKNPVYAGVYVFGRRPARKTLVAGQIRMVRADGRDPEKWAVRIDGAHPGYITWEDYVKNQEKLRDNFLRKGHPTRGAPREGAALLAGLLICGRCGHRMVTYYATSPRTSYYCRGDRDKAEKTCWVVPAPPLDCAVEKLFLETMVPSEIELGLAVEREVGTQAGTVERHWELRIEQATYEARRAERRYKAVDPDNRVVARTLEREWEERLQQLDEVQRQRDEAKRQRRVELTDEDRERIRTLARDLSKVWRAPSTLQADRKAMLRLVIEAISLSPIEVPTRSTHVKVAWKTGAVTELQVPRPSSYDRRSTPSAILDRIKALAAAGVHDREIVKQLNSAGLLTGADKPWSLGGVRWLRYHFGISRTAPDIPRCLPIPDRHSDGRYSVAGAARIFGVSSPVVRGWVRRRLVNASVEPYGRFKRVCWLVIDDDTAARLRSMIAAGARRAGRTDTNNDHFFEREGVS